MNRNACHRGQILNLSMTACSSVQGSLSRKEHHELCVLVHEYSIETYMHMHERFVVLYIHPWKAACDKQSCMPPWRSPVKFTVALHDGMQLRS